MRPFTLKFGEKQAFALRLVARLRGGAMGGMLEQLVENMANDLNISRHWLELWDDEPSVRMLNLFALPEYKPVTSRQASAGLVDETSVRSFVLAHPQFFYADKARTIPKRQFAVVLWPHVEELAQLWKKKRDEDYHVAAKQMVALLKKAKLDPPAVG